MPFHVFYCFLEFLFLCFFICLYCFISHEEGHHRLKSWTKKSHACLKRQTFQNYKKRRRWSVASKKGSLNGSKINRCFNICRQKDNSIQLFCLDERSFWCNHFNMENLVISILNVYILFWL